MQQIAPGVYVNTDFKGCNVGLIETRDGNILIDTPMVPSDNQKWLGLIRQVTGGKKTLYVINTDHHRGHVLGNQFYNAPVIAHDLAWKNMRGYGANFCQRVIDSFKREPKVQAELANLQIVRPTITFDTRLDIEHGGRTVRLDPRRRAHRGHDPHLAARGKGAVCRRHGLVRPAPVYGAGQQQAVAGGVELHPQAKPADYRARPRTANHTRYHHPPLGIHPLRAKAGTGPHSPRLHQAGDRQLAGQEPGAYVPRAGGSSRQDQVADQAGHQSHLQRIQERSDGKGDDKSKDHDEDSGEFDEFEAPLDDEIEATDGGEYVDGDVEAEEDLDGDQDAVIEADVEIALPDDEPFDEVEDLDE